MDVKVAHNNCKTFVQLSLCSPADDLNESLARDISELSISEKKQNCNNADNYELENGYLHRLLRSSQKIVYLQVFLTRLVKQLHHVEFNQKKNHVLIKNSFLRKQI